MNQLLYPKTQPDAFILQQNLTWSEWDKRRAWVGDHWYNYSTLDRITGYRAHRGVDLQDHIEDDDPYVYSGVYGTWHVGHVDSYFGNHSVIVAEGWRSSDGRQLLIQDSHMSRLLLRDGAHVRPDTRIGIIGRSGNASGIHDHTTCYDDRGYGWFWGGYPAVLAKMKEELMSLADDVANRVAAKLNPRLDKVEKEISSLYGLAPGKHHGDPGASDGRAPTLESIQSAIEER